MQTRIFLRRVKEVKTSRKRLRKEGDPFNLLTGSFTKQRKWGIEKDRKRERNMWGEKERWRGRRRGAGRGRN